MTVAPGDLPAGLLDDLSALLALPTVAAWGGDAMVQGACWLRSRLGRAGLSARLLSGPAGAAPYVYAQGLQRADRPTLLIYGHYDVQPARLADGWSGDPFTARLEAGRIVARGTMDQKMNLLLPIVALEGLGEAPAFNIKVFLEGEEEIFSPHLPEALTMYRDLLACDLCLSSDGWQAGPQLGDLRLGLRGFCGVEVTLQGAAKDLHSGTFGGAVPNPALALARMLSGLWDARGQGAFDGFLDGVQPPTPQEVAQAGAGFDPVAWRQRAGLAPDQPLPADPEVGPAQVGLHPALELNAMEAGGYAGGFRSIVPSQASARVSARLVPGQQPERVQARLVAALERAAPAGFTPSLTPMPGMARPYRIAADHPGQALAARALQQADGQAPRFTYSGGSIPLLGEIDHQLGVKTVIFGFGLPDGNMHGVDEFIRLTDIRRGLIAWRALLRDGGYPRQAGRA